MAIYFVVDDQSPELTYSCPVTKEVVSGAYFNKTWTTVASDECQDGWFEYTFYGTEVEVIAFSSTLQNYSVKIDNSPWVAQYGRGALQSPPLADGQHTISYASGTLVTPTLDYLVVKAGASTPLQDRTIIVDDSDPGLVYGGDWSTQVPSSNAKDLSTASFRNTTHWSTTVGDTFEFSFSGSSVAVFGSFANISVGHNFSATYFVDGIPTVASIPHGTLDGLPLTRLFSSTEISEGTHTLSVNITQIYPPLAIGFDFLTFNASFPSLDKIPKYSTKPSSSNRVGAIVGGVLGGVVILVTILTIMLLRRRKRGYSFPNMNLTQRDLKWSELK